MPNRDSFIRNQFGDYYLPSANSNAFNIVGSSNLFNHFYGEKLFIEDTLTIVIGSDSGLLIKHISDNIPEGSRYIFIESNPIIGTIFEHLESQNISNKIEICSIDNWEDVAHELSNYFMLNRCRVIESIGATDQHLDYPEIHKNISERFQKLRWDYQTKLLTPAFVPPTLKNSPCSHTSAKILEGKLEGYTALILAGGPSLDELLPWAKKHWNDVITISIGRVSTKLVEQNLHPNFVVTIDPHAISFDVSKDTLRHDPEKTVLINSSHASPELVNQWPGRNLYLDQVVPWKSELNIDTVPATGPTVTNSAVNFAQLIGVRQIIFLGLDLCFTEDGRTHASINNKVSLPPQLTGITQQVETNSGKVANTISDYYIAIQNISEQARIAEKHNIDLINLSHNGAKIPSIRFVDPNEINIEHPHTPPLETINTYVTNRGKQYLLSHYGTLSNELTSMKHGLLKARELAKKGLHYNNGLFGRLSKPADFKYKIKMDKVQKELDGKLSHITNAVIFTNMQSFSKIIRPDTERELSDEAVEKSGEDYYQSYIDGATTLKNEITKTIDQIKSMREELQDTPDYSMIFGQWIENKYYGRAHILKARLFHENLDQSTQKEIESFKKKYADLFKSSTDGIYYKKITSERNNLRGVSKNAKRLFNSKDSEGLKNLVHGLQQINNRESESLLLLTNGYHAELIGDQGQAISHYGDLIQMALEEHTKEETPYAGSIIENAALQLASIFIKMGKPQSADYVFDLLISLSPIHLPLYGHFLQVLKNPEGALEAYQKYITHYPNDLSILYKIASLQIDGGQKENARSTIEAILQIDPDNSSIHGLLVSIS